MRTPRAASIGGTGIIQDPVSGPQQGFVYQESNMFVRRIKLAFDEMLRKLAKPAA